MALGGLLLMLCSCTHSNESVPPAYRLITDILGGVLAVVGMWMGYGVPSDWGPR